MKVKELIQLLKQEDKELDVIMFAHDHDPHDHTQGVGLVVNVSQETDNKGKTFVALHG